MFNPHKPQSLFGYISSTASPLELEQLDLTKILPACSLMNSVTVFQCCPRYNSSFFATRLTVFPQSKIGPGWPLLHSGLTCEDYFSVYCFRAISSTRLPSFVLLDQQSQTYVTPILVARAGQRLGNPVAPESGSVIIDEYNHAQSSSTTT